MLIELKRWLNHIRAYSLVMVKILRVNHIVKYLWVCGDLVKILIMNHSVRLFVSLRWFGQNVENELHCIIFIKNEASGILNILLYSFGPYFSIGPMLI